GHVISTLVNMTAAVTLTAAFRWSPWTLVLGVVLVVGSYLGGRASADARIDRMRLEAMQRATHALAAGLNLSEAVPSFLSEVRFGFDVDESTLVLFEAEQTIAHSVRAVDKGAFDGHY